MAIFKGLSYLAPSRVLSQVDKVPFAELPLQHLMFQKSVEIEEQYRKISHVNWKETETFETGTIPRETVEFWSKVRNFKTVQGQFAFRDLADYCLTCLSLPFANAFVERVFSLVTYVKNKQRNRMSTKNLNLNSRKKCCKDLKVSQSMLNKFSTENMYASSEPDSEDLDLLAHFD